MPYSNSTEYAKYLKKKCEDHNHGDEGCQGGCNESKEGCGCCPPGLISVEDNTGANVGCQTPNDAELYYRNTFKCPDGYIKTFTVAGNFVGCLSADDYTTYMTNPQP